MTYEKPAVVDYGDLRALTSSVILGGPEDGASKDVDQHHSFL